MMASDIDYDRFDYNSSQDSFDIDYQIDLFEFRCCVKSKKSKQKIKNSTCPMSVKTLKSHSIFVKSNCKSYKKTPKAERKSFRYDHYPKETKVFESDEQLISAQPNFSKKLQVEHLESFSNFRRYFYDLNHQSIKTSFTNQPNLEIIDIRLASINESVQNDFMTTLNQNPAYFPQLVYLGTKLKNIENILRYGFLIPNQAHPSNSEAPIIISEHGQSYDIRIYCSRTAAFPLSCINSTNTLFVCATILKRDKFGKSADCHGNMIVLSDMSRIVPLFLIDFNCLNDSGVNRPWFNQKQKGLITNKNNQIEKSVVISRKYLRKKLDWMNDKERKNNQHQIRSCEFHY